MVRWARSLVRREAFAKVRYPAAVLFGLNSAGCGRRHTFVAYVIRGHWRYTTAWGAGG